MNHDMNHQKTATQWYQRLMNTEIIFNYVENKLYYSNVSVQLDPTVLHLLDEMVNKPLAF